MRIRQLLRLVSKAHQEGYAPISMLSGNSHKPIKWLLLILPLIMIAGLFGTYYTHRLTKQNNLSHQNIVKRPPQAKFHISGIDFHSTIAGKDILSIQADRFTIKKKKLGLFRFGLMNEGLFENTHVRIYGQWQSGKVPSEQADGGGPIRPIAVNDNPGSLSEAASFMPDRQSDQLTFNNIFSTAAFPNLPIKKVASIVMKPVQVDLYNGQTHLTRISASRAFLRFKQRDIQFKGNVTVVTGKRILTADELIFVPEKAAMKTMGAYTLRTPEGQWRGKRMVMDIFLASNRLARSGTDNNH